MCLAPPVIEDFKLRDLTFLLATSEDKNVIALDGQGYEDASANDNTKLTYMQYFGLVALHYKNCIKEYNKGATSE